MNAATTNLPLTAPLPAELTPLDVFQRLSSLPHVVFFDSASQDDTIGRYSFVAADPFQWMTSEDELSDPLTKLEQAWCQFPAKTLPDLPPFQGGVAGLFGYELARSLESIPAARIEDLSVPTLAVGLYDVVFAFDHVKRQAWILSQGFPETDPQARRERAEDRLYQAQQWLTKTFAATAGGFAAKPPAELGPQFDVGLGDVTSNFSADNYRQMIELAIEYIHAGDIFQVNLAQRLLSRARTDSLDLYLQLRQKNPAPYAGYLDLGEWQVCSTSPECFLTLRDREVETRPIKGTRGRSGQPEADLYTGDDLQLSEKDRAENVMIVDLLRNDLSRVCVPDSVHVAQLCQLETFAYVKHLVSIVRGTLQTSAGPFDLLRACFPGGSITGAPKIRAMEIIAELEPTTRGAYCGSLGYIGFDGQMDSSILIRTITAGQGWWQMPVGGGIVAQSTPEDEYRETWHKARGMLESLK
ncbi:MAG: aminodeoxychorismate synthase component I [Planctomycetes bacterium]|nr:aminodeoxychorismate synthase component I [Planctomycetota bacterium]